MNQPSTTAGTWVPDWKALDHAATTFMYGRSYPNDDEYLLHKYAALWDEIQRQAAAAGLMLICRADVQHMFDLLEQEPRGDYPFSYTGIGGRVDAALAATPGEKP